MATSGILVGLLLGALDATIVGTAMPKIVTDLQGIEIYFLVFSGFMVASTVSIPIWGRLSDIYGRRSFHLAGVVIFTGASVLCGTSETMGQLVGFRALQGLGAGALISLSFTMIGDLYPLEQRAKMQGAISGVWGLASMVGPLLGGFITETWHWKWVFFVNIPVGVITAVLVQISWRDEPVEIRGRPDVPGGLLLAFSSAALLAGIAYAGRDGWLEPMVLKCLGAAVVGVIFLVLVERRSSDPFMAYDLYRMRIFATGAATGVCAVTCLFAATSYIPLFVYAVVGTESTQAGAALIPMMIPWMIGSGLSGYLLLRLGYRTMAVAGMCLCTLAYGMLARLGVGSTWWDVAFAMMPLGAGLGITIAPLLIAVQNAVPKARLGASTSLTQFTRSMGAAIGVAVMGSLMSLALQGVADPNTIMLERDTQSPEKLALLMEPLANGLGNVFLFTFVIAFIGILISLTIPGGKAQDQVLTKT